MAQPTSFVAPSANMLDPAEQLLAGAPPPLPTPVASPEVSKLQAFCLSRIGVALIATVLLGVLLVFLQPKYVFTKTSDPFETPQLNYTVIGVLAVAGGLVVYATPSFLGRASCQ